ncbi:trypsin-like serine protease [Pseudomonas xanthosomatis]|uniref:trypsin-like serine protease n=1 Tax=Pseudomonas xanthosomatis TaxID=2842356 RepID=UPI003511628C
MNKASVLKCLEKAKQIASAAPSSIGVDYGHVYRRGERLSRLGIRFHVPEKIDAARLPDHLLLPKKIDGLRCDVIERVYEPHTDSSDLFNPLISGILIGNYQRSTSGTLGFFARDASGRIGLVSNWHVLAYASDWQTSEEIQQPRNSRNVASPQIMREPLTGYDIGFAVLHEQIACSNEALNLNLSITGVEKPKANMLVVKYGAATGRTEGIVESQQGGTIPVVYSRLNNQTYFLNAFCIKAAPGSDQVISDNGDSGSAWINPETGKIVGIHVGGRKGEPNVAVAHCVSDVLLQLGLRIITA